MKQNKKGFTLIELLAVIVILAIIALIAVPVIMNIISSARKSAFEDTAYGIIKAGELYYANALLNDGMTSDAEFTFTEWTISPEGLSIQGSLPQSGKLVVTTDGKVAIAISNGTYCITKGYDESKIITTDEFESCELPAGASSAKTLSELAKTNDFATTVNVCATSGVCAPGTEFAIEVAPGNIQNFYVVSDVDNTVTLIMDSNIGETVAWISKTDYLNAGGTEVDYGSYGNNNKGPITALNYLESQTSGWTNIASKDYTLIDDNTTASYEIERTKARVRMLTKTEALSLGCQEGTVGCPTWIYENLDNNNPPYAYWLSSASVTSSDFAHIVHNIGSLSDDRVNGGGYGVRPVIEISK